MNADDRTQNLSQALAQITSGAFVLTIRDAQNGPQGILLSFVQQVGLAPPRIVAAIQKERPIIPLLERTGAFVLNICAESDRGQLSRLAEGPAEMAKVLAEQGVRQTGPGVVLESACAHVVGKVSQRVDIGDHWLYIADVVEGAAVAGRSPLVHVRRSGLRY
jgi:flavin reductase (DIM6/NTAB) family NADH-FMN oxidoreductase RutF